jgi:hypothetical protein
MSIGSRVNIVLDDKLSNEKCSEIQKRISKMNGVLSAFFNEKAKEIYVIHTGVNKNVEQEIQKIEGVKDIKPSFTL